MFYQSGVINTSIFFLNFSCKWCNFSSVHKKQQKTYFLKKACREKSYIKMKILITYSIKMFFFLSHLYAFIKIMFTLFPHYFVYEMKKICTFNGFFSTYLKKTCIVCKEIRYQFSKQFFGSARQKRSDSFKTKIIFSLEVKIINSHRS